METKKADRLFGEREAVLGVALALIGGGVWWELGVGPAAITVGFLLLLLVLALFRRALPPPPPPLREE